MKSNASTDTTIAQYFKIIYMASDDVNKLEATDIFTVPKQEQKEASLKE